MNSKQFLEKHNGIIDTALNDYLRWFDEGDENYDSIKTAINDFYNIEDIKK